MIALVAAAIGLAAWIYLVAFRSGFWLTRATDDAPFPPPAIWPSVTAVVPARDEAEVIGRAIASLAAQDYPGPFRVILVDDGSSDGTAEIARAAAQKASPVRANSTSPARPELVEACPERLPQAGSRRGLFFSSGGKKNSASTSSARTADGGSGPAEAEGKLTVIAGSAPPRGWTGKLWAMRNGVAAAGAPDLLWFTDADITHAPDTLRRLVARSVAERLVLHSLMVELRCASLAERALVPAFVFFFEMLYPFAAVNRPGAPVAAAAGGCMLVDAAALDRAGGLPVIAASLIDDCAMGRALKGQGAIRLALTHRSHSIRPYGGWRDIGAMVARSAYAQLGYAPPALAGTLAGMVLVYLLPPLFALFGHGAVRWIGLAAWALMALAFQPMLRFYRRSPVWGVALPLIGAFYAGATFASAWAHWRGRGGMWKGRAQAELMP